MTRWGKAGEPLDPAEQKARAVARGRDRQRDKVALAEARAAWEAGWVRPFLITRYLNLRGLEGPEVDIACGAAEPDVDDWENGFTYPTWEQLVLLADLCDVHPRAFIRANVYDEPNIVTAASLGSLAFHAPPEVVARIVGQPIVKYWAHGALRDRGIEPGAASAPTKAPRPDLRPLS